LYIVFPCVINDWITTMLTKNVTQHENDGKIRFIKNGGLQFHRV
jgi:hypothetical protein